MNKRQVKIYEPVLSKERKMNSNDFMFDSDRNCSECHYYRMIDSGYGYCRRFPPVEKQIHRRKWFIFLTFEYYIEYTVVEWNRLPCGEFVKSCR